MKDEVKGFPIIDFVGLKPQTYSFKAESSVCDGSHK